MDDELHFLLQTILDQNKRILESLETMATKEDLSRIVSDVNMIELWINGNGTEGMKSKIRRLEEDVSGLKLGVKNIVDEVVKSLTMRAIKVFGIPLSIALFLWIAGLVRDLTVLLGTK